MKSKRKKITLLIIGLSSLFVFIANYSIEINANGKTYSNTSKIPKNKVGLVLGTAKKLKNGNQNLFFSYRINAVVKLFQKGKINFILVSGDNGTKNYDEPTDFKNELIKRGIPAKRIFLDYAGFSTLDSVVRAKKIFDQNKFTVISQQFHNERAIYLAEKHGIKAIGFNAQNVPGKSGFKVKVREILARTKAFLDIIFGRKPKFLGNKIEIK